MVISLAMLCLTLLSWPVGKVLSLLGGVFRFLGGLSPFFSLTIFIIAFIVDLALPTAPDLDRKRTAVGRLATGMIVYAVLQGFALSLPILFALFLGQR